MCLLISFTLFNNVSNDCTLNVSQALHFVFVQLQTVLGSRLKKTNRLFGYFVLTVVIRAVKLKINPARL